MGRFTLTPRAEADLYEIWATIAADNIPAADRLYHRVLHKGQLAAEHPHMGSPRPELSPTARILVEGAILSSMNRNTMA